MKFTDQLWNGIEPVYEAILELPFIRKLTAGTLPEEVFLFYLKQDTLYLSDFSRALSIAGIRSDEHMHDFFTFANNAVVGERELHRKFYEKHGVKMDASKSPACFSYTNFLLSTAVTKDNAISIAALLPCFWIYREVGIEVYNQSADDNPYKEWIDTYAGEEFNESVSRAIEITNEVVQTEPESRRKEMEEAFRRSSQLEWMFWDSAYRQEQWPLESIIEAQ